MEVGQSSFGGVVVGLSAQATDPFNGGLQVVLRRFEFQVLVADHGLVGQKVVHRFRFRGRRGDAARRVLTFQGGGHDATIQRGEIRRGGLGGVFEGTTMSYGGGGEMAVPSLEVWGASERRDDIVTLLEVGNGVGILDFLRPVEGPSHPDSKILAFHEKLPFLARECDPCCGMHGPRSRG